MQEDVTAELSEDKNGAPCITVSLRDLRGTGFWPRDYVDLNINGAIELQSELNDAIEKLEKITPDDE